MRRTLLISVFVALAACAGPSSQTAEGPPPALNTAAATPLAPPPQVARSPEALAAMLADYDRAVAAHANDETLAAMRDAIAKMAGQRDADVSRLYWYTDLNLAKAAAQKSGKPILSLRLLGRLDDEMSCANSRLFRIVLYSNAEVSQFLRDNYVLHWSSERPAPKMTLDYGDGRVVERTIAGNSVHYVLDARGRIVDALPGLYGPTAFERGLRESLSLAKTSANLDDAEATKEIASYHGKKKVALTATWQKVLRKVYPQDGADEDYAKYTLPELVSFDWPQPLYDSVPAVAVNELTQNKAGMEGPPLTLLQPKVSISTPWSEWDPILATAEAEHLDASSRALLQSKHPRDWSTSDAAELSADKLAKQIAALEGRITEEGLRNEFLFHGALHGEMSKASHVDLTRVNDFVYAKMFMTPWNDPWLGLLPQSALTGMAEDGVVEKPAKNSANATSAATAAND